MALSENKIVETKNQPVQEKLKVVDGAIHIYRGANLSYEAGNIGYVKLGTDTVSQEFAGIALDELDVAAADNTANGTYEIEVLTRKCGKWVKRYVTSTITIANEGDIVYTDGDDAVDLSTGIVNTTNGAVGTIRKFIDSHNAWVSLDQ